MIGRPNGAPVSITGLGTYAPDRVVTNDELAELVDTSDEWITERTGIKERRIAAPEQAMTDLALPAARTAAAGSTSGFRAAARARSPTRTGW